MIDSTIVLDNKKLIVESTIAEGGFGYVHKVRDQESNCYYALKKINSTDKETQSEIENEIEILKSLQRHPHIMEFIAYTKISPENAPNGNGRGANRFSYLILCEYCDRGTLADLELPIQELEKSCRVIYQVALALKHMHNLGVIHRDIKAENVLFDKNGRVKLCDFGSSTLNKYEPNISWTPIERATVEEEMQRHTTPLYRPPEILETYLHYPINCAIDIWAFGCLIYFMRFGQHAFPDSGKLSIVNCCYTVPKDVSASDPLVSIIRQCLKPDPNERISIQSLINSLKVEFEDLDGSVVPFTSSEINNSVREEQVEEVISPPKKLSIKSSAPVMKDKSPSSPKMLSSPVADLVQKVHQESKLPSGNVETLIELANTSSSSSSSFEHSKKSPSAGNIPSSSRDLARKAGLTEELLNPDVNANSTSSKSVDNIDALFDMCANSPNIVSDLKILSPEKATIVNKSNSSDKRDAFDDLLESFGTALPSNGLCNNNKQPIVKSTCSYDGFGIDPKMKILDWKDSRRGNIRALLSSLHLVLSEEFRWKQIGMHQLVTDADVKKVYRSACLAVHPDKVTNCDEETKDVAKMVFTELNEAWTKFEGR